MADESDPQSEQQQDDEARGQPAQPEEDDGSQDEQTQPGQEGRQEGRQRQQRAGGQAEDGDDVEEPPRKLSGVELAARGKRHLREMTGYTPETVSGLERVGDGWRLTLEVVELSRIPPSTDVLGTYQLDLTEDGELAGYRRSARYHRSQAEG